MKLKRFSSWISAIVLSISALLTVGFSGVAHAGTGTYYKWTGASSGTAGLGGCTLNCWSVAGNWDVSSDGGSTYITASSAPNSTDNGGAGDNLVFDNSSLGAATTLKNDITGLNVDTITSQGTGTYPDYFTLSGNAFNLVNGELGAAPNTVPQLIISSNVTISTSQSYGQAGINYDAIQFSGTLTIPTGITLTAASPINIQTGAGGGSLILTGATSGNQPYYHSIVGTSTFSGSIEIQSAAQLSIGAADALGTAAITINSGGQLFISDSTTSSSDTVTIPNSITMAGNGSGVSDEDQGAILAALTDTNNYNLTSSSLAVNLTGPVTLTGNTELASFYPNTTTYNITGTYNAGAFSLTSVAASQPTYGATTIELNGTAIATSTSEVAAPKTPDTGVALIEDHFWLPLAGSLVVASGLIVTPKLRHQTVTKKR